MSRVYQAIKNINFIVFFIAYVVICTIIVLIFDLCNNLFIDSEIMLRFELGFPIILQLILTYIVYRENHEIRMMKILFIVVFLYTMVCGILSLYELYFTYPSFGDDLIYYVSIAQILFQFVLVLLLVVCLLAKLVNKLAVIIPLFMVCINLITGLILEFGDPFFDSDLTFWIFIIAVFVNIFNPVLIYILSYIAKGKLFIKYNREIPV